MFDRLNKLDVTGKTAEFILFILEEPNPVLTLRPAGMENKEWLNAMLRIFGSQQQVKSLRNGASVENIEKSRKAVRDLYPSFVVTGWRGVRNDGGTEVPFSVDACKELFRKLPDYIVDDIRAFAEVPENFLDLPAVDTEVVAGN